MAACGSPVSRDMLGSAATRRRKTKESVARIATNTCTCDRKLPGGRNVCTSDMAQGDTSVDGGRPTVSSHNTLYPS